MEGRRGLWAPPVPAHRCRWLQESCARFELMPGGRSAKPMALLETKAEIISAVCSMAPWSSIAEASAEFELRDYNSTGRRREYGINPMVSVRALALVGIVLAYLAASPGRALGESKRTVTI